MNCIVALLIRADPKDVRPMAHRTVNAGLLRAKRVDHWFQGHGYAGSRTYL